MRSLYEGGALKLARKILGETNLSQDVKSVEVVETENGFAIQFTFPDHLGRAGS